MRRILILFIAGALLLSAGAFAGGEAKGRRPLVKLKGTATLQTHYCGGGAAPTEEMIRRASGTFPIRGAEFLVVKGQKITGDPPAATFKTDSAGRFTVELGTGTWCVFRAERKPPAPSGARDSSSKGPPDPYVDQECLRAEQRRCDAVYVVGDKAPKSLDLGIVAGCSDPWNQPCWRGPMPPSTASPPAPPPPPGRK